jgi:hypothetical protein
MTAMISFARGTRASVSLFLAFACPSAALLAASTTVAPIVLFGKIVTMGGEVIDSGAVYCQNGNITAAQKRTDPAPGGFSDAVQIETQGVIYPGLIDLHNHLNYNVLTLWNPPKKYGDRYEWRDAPSYHRDISVPMRAILAQQGLSPAVVRYVEAKLLVGGTTSAQGMSLKPGESALYNGIVRNLEQTDDTNYPEIATQLEDWSKMQADARETMRKRVEAGRRFFHHLAEGKIARAHKGYEDVRDEKFPRTTYVGIHCLALTAADWKEFAQTGATAVWSPTSNLLLYGETVDLASVVSSGVVWGLGSDWSPSGTKNPLGEMKVAWLAAQAAGVNLSYRAVAEAATSRAAVVAGWEGKLGTIAAGYGADLLVVKSNVADPYENLVRATEKDIVLVTIEGVPRYGDEALMLKSGVPSAKLEKATIAGRARLLYFEHPDAPSQMNGLSLATATQKLEYGMSHLDVPPPQPFFKELGFTRDPLPLSLEMDLAAGSEILTPDAKGFMKILSSPTEPPRKSVPLDKLTVADDPDFFKRLEAVGHAPAFLKKLKDFYP